MPKTTLQPNLQSKLIHHQVTLYHLLRNLFQREHPQKFFVDHQSYQSEFTLIEFFTMSKL
jgi:hypothetical protein